MGADAGGLGVFDGAGGFDGGLWESAARAVRAAHGVCESAVAAGDGVWVALVTIGMVEGVLAASNMPTVGAEGIIKRTPQEVAVGVGWDADDAGDGVPGEPGGAGPEAAGSAAGAAERADPADGGAAAAAAGGASAT